MREFHEVYAVPGANHIIDVINPDTGLTVTFGRDEANVKAEHPDAIRLTWGEWQADAVKRQNTPIRWTETDEHTYTNMLEVLPPALWIGGGFLVGEPWDHSYETGAPRFAAYLHRNGRYYTASRPLTCAEFRKAIA